MPRTPVEPPKDTDCGCSFQFDADGRPEILCPDETSQDLVFAALRSHPDVAVRINALQPEKALVGAEEPDAEEAADEDLTDDGPDLGFIEGDDLDDPFDDDEE